MKKITVTATFTLTQEQWHELRNAAGVYMMREGCGRELTLEQHVIMDLCVAARQLDEVDRELPPTTFPQVF